MIIVIKSLGLYTARTMAVLPAMLTIFSSSVEAAEWKMDSTINQALSYDDNFRMAQSPEGSIIYQLTPTLNFARKTELWDIKSNASYGVQSYTNKNAQNQNPQRYELSSQYRTERSNLDLSANYSITPSRNTATQDSGNFASNASAESQSFSPSYSYKITERDSLISSASYTKTTYSTTDFRDNENQSINLGWQRQWTERINYSISPFYAVFKSGQGQSKVNSDSYGVNLSAGYLLSEQWQLNGTIGGRVTDTTTETEVIPGLIITDQNTSQGWLASLNAKYKGERLASSFGLNRSLVPSGQGQLTEQTGINLDLSYQLSERLSSTLSASYQQTDSVSNDNNENNGLSRTNISLSPGLNWKLTQDWNLSASYQHRKQERKNPNTIVADSNVYMLTLNYNWPGLSISR